LNQNTHPPPFCCGPAIWHLLNNIQIHSEGPQPWPVRILWNGGAHDGNGSVIVIIAKFTKQHVQHFFRLLGL